MEELDGLHFRERVCDTAVWMDGFLQEDVA